VIPASPHVYRTGASVMSGPGGEPMSRDLAHMDQALHATRQAYLTAVDHADPDSAVAAHELLDELLEERHAELTRLVSVDALVSE
jgi:hypothetical protein